MERPLPFGAQTGADCTPPAPPGTQLPSASFPQRRLGAVTTLGRALGHGHPAPTSSFSGVLCLGLAPEGCQVLPVEEKPEDAPSLPLDGA